MTIDAEGAPPGNGEELADLLRRMGPKLRKILAANRIPPEDAEDVIGETLLHFTRKQALVQTPEAWLPVALRMQCKMYWRTRSRRRTEVVDPAIFEVLPGGAGSEAERRVLRRELSRLIAKLDRRCRDLLRLRYGLGLDAGETAQRTRYKKSSVDKTTRRCVDALSKKITAAALRNRTGKR